MMMNIVLVLYIDAYFENIDIIQDIQVTEIMNTGVLQSDYNFDAWDYGVVKQIIQHHMQNYYQPNN